MGKKAVSYLFYNVYIVFTIILPVLAWRGYMAASVDPNDSVWLPIMALVAPFLFVVNVITIVYWIFRRRWWFVFPIASILFYIPFVMSVWSFGKGKSDQQFDNTIKVATYNVHSFSHGDLLKTAEQIAYYLNNENVDVVCIQEIAFKNKFNMDSIAKLFDGLVYYRKQKYEDEGNDLAIFSRYPLINNNIPQEPRRGMITSDLQINDSLRIRLVNMHLVTTGVSGISRQSYGRDLFDKFWLMLDVVDALRYNGGSRAVQIDHVTEIVEESPYPVLVCGDMNDIPASYTYGELVRKMKDSFIQCGEGYGYTFKPFFKIMRIDYIFYTDNLRCVKYKSEDIKLSDHNPVIAEFAF